MDSEAEPYRHYTLGLGRLIPDQSLKKATDPQLQEELLFIKREKEREEEITKAADKLSQPVYKKTTYAKPDRSGAIKRLFDKTEVLIKERARGTAQNLNNQCIDENRLIATADPAKERERQIAIMTSDANEIALYKGKELALPYLNQGLVPVDETRELTELKRRRETWSAVPKEDRRESVREYIQNTRSILLARIAMKEKKQEAERMREYIQQKESVLNLNKEIYEQDKKMVDRYVSFMKDKAYAQKVKADTATKERKEKELELEQLIRHRTDLKKRLGEDKEKCATYKVYVDFMLSLNESIKKEINERREKRPGVYVTQQGVKEKDVEVRSEIMDEELNEIKRDLGLSENDSDTEIPPGFSSVEEMLALMQKHEANNLRSIQDAQKREDSLERVRKQYVQKAAEKNKLLEHIRKDLKELAEEEKKKMARLKELNQKMESDTLDMAASEFSTEEKRKQAQMMKDLKEKIKKGVVQIKNELAANKLDPKHKELYSEDKSGKDIPTILEYITSRLMELKMLRDWKFIGSSETEKEALRKKESDENAEMKRERAEAVRKKNISLAEKKKSDLIANWKIPRFKKYGKEMMKRKMLKEGPKKKDENKVQKVDDEFDDKYFIDQ
eukprot:TRINITY_DN1265_c0_g2_i1.p2 TRINITY_DN1265_c0_g2~~TRINITY_DN1265_c0_g2_i1.p2  ORF type:complete len:618 (+),score=115.76 TRINITY_DN1265_c0_g2_i1:2225-4078(+)